jgi:predicted ATP-binding protein involved in virulence
MIIRKQGRAIRALKNNAKNLNIASLYQLYFDYLNGVDVDQDNEAAQGYLDQCVDLLSREDCKLRIKKMGFFGFRKFNKFHLDFDSKLTVLIGDNGAGKTSVIDAIVKMLSWVSANIEKEGKGGNQVTYSDINISDFQYGEINVAFELNANSSFRASLSRAIKGAAQRKDSSIEELRALANIYRVINSKIEVDLPLFAFYAAERSYTKPDASIKLDEYFDGVDTSSRFDAYKGALDGIAKFRDFVKWFTVFEALATQSKPVDILPLIARHSELKSILDKKTIKNSLHYEDKDWDEYNQLTQKIVNSSIPQYDALAQEKLKIFKQAIIKLTPGITDIFIDRQTGQAELKIRCGSERSGSVNISQLSQGQQTVIAFSSDIARRLMMLNPNLENPLNGHGIVLIDEIELHLHPKWQQQIVLNLQECFPNIQFILTTHSPQILSTVDVKSIRRLGLDENDEICLIPTNFQTKGVMSSDVLERIMETASTPAIAEAKLMSDFLHNVSQGKLEDDETVELLNKLKRHFGENHPLLEKCEKEIAFQGVKKNFLQKFRRDGDAT